MEGLCPCGHEPTGSIVPVSTMYNTQNYYYYYYYYYNNNGNNNNNSNNKFISGSLIWSKTLVQLIF